MSTIRTFKQKLAHVSRLWEQHDYAAALAEVEALRQTWPGNAHLAVLWASLVQLQEETSHSLDDAKLALQHAVELEKNSPAAAIELGHFLDSVEDNPTAAVKSYAEGITLARQLLVDGLVGQARAYRQLDKKDEFLRCVQELLAVAGPDAEAVHELLEEWLPVPS